MKTRLTVITAFTASLAFADPADPQISNVQVSQDPANRQVSVTYALDEAAIVTMDVLTNGVSIGGENINHIIGDCNKLVQSGPRSLVWKPHKSWPDHKFTAPVVSVKLTAWAKDCPPDYMVCDLVSGAVTYYVSTNFVPDGIFNDAYVSTKMILRKISAAGQTFTMGASSTWGGYADGTDDGSGSNGYVHAPAHQVSFNKDYYIGIYPLTRKQLICVQGSIMTGDEGTDMLSAATRISYNALRGTTEGAKWPSSSGIDSNSILYKLRSKFANAYAFDLPTEAQWEFACKAGTTGESYLEAYGLSLDKVTLSDYFDPYPGEDKKRMGTYLPNPWGLYGMNDKPSELCLDWAYVYDTQAQTDPKGASSGAKRICRGGGGTGYYYTLKSWWRFTAAPDSGRWAPNLGCRICLTID